MDKGTGRTRGWQGSIRIGVGVRDEEDVTLSSGNENLTREIRLFIDKNFEKEFKPILEKRDDLIRELFEIGITSRIRLDRGHPLGVQVELVRKEMEDLSADLEVQLPSLPRKFQKTKRKLKGLAARCNQMSAQMVELERRVQEKMRYTTKDKKQSGS